MTGKAGIPVPVTRWRHRVSYGQTDAMGGVSYAMTCIGSSRPGAISSKKQKSARAAWPDF